MKRIVAMALACMMAAVTACGGTSGGNASGQGESQAAQGPEQAAGDTVTVRVNTDGLGEIAFSETGEAPAFEEDYPMTSAYANVVKGTTVAMNARGQEDYVFVKWTRDGEFYSSDAEIAPVIDADTEYIAVFLMAGSYDGPAVTDVKDAKTMADILALPNYATSTTETLFVRTFELNGMMYRAVARLAAETAQQIFDLDFEDPEYDAKFNEIVAPLQIDQMDNLTEMIPDQEELDGYAGMTGEQLLEDGWTFSWFNVEDMECGMENGLFTYAVTFDGEVEAGTEIDEETIRPLTVVSVRYDGLGDITAGLEEAED
ncbi:MAG: hypothetical protein IKG66_06380 [Lachnospiraceae bacterium]|nr:hypothetical protein [Lachnospiraceae bacterium]